MTSSSTSLFFTIHVDRCAVHTPLQGTRRIPTANPGREALAALHSIGKICAIRSLLIGPKVLEAEQGRGDLLFPTTGRVGNSASMLQMTYRFKGFHCAVSH